ncbi:MAG TPA: O-antigen ligase family protein [Bryobacteraceae bacterium]|nr:O-antigen ligase family protein [Bryobacteraceae bacterium]
MQVSREDLGCASFYLAVASAVAVLISISASQILLGLSLGALLASRTKLRLPRMWLPLSLFLTGTLLSLMLSPNPAHGLPQVKKMFVFSMLLVIFSTVRDLRIARRLFLVWVWIGAVVACFGLVRFATSLYQAHVEQRGLYEFYLENRFTGFMSHPMTFAGQDMVVLLMLLAFLFFAPGLRMRAFAVGSLCAALLGAALLINGTRSVWLAVAVAGVWLLWRWKRWLAAIAPAVIVLFIWLVPGPVHDRAVSIFQPRKDIDSNEFRVICFRTGARMIAAHPWFGIGLDETKYQFLDYMTPDERQSRPPGFYQHLHNFYLQYAAERGIPTLMMMLWLLALVLYDFYRTLHQLPPGRSNERFMLHGGIATVIGIMVGGLFEVNLGDTEVLTVFLVVVACGYIAVSGFHQREPGNPTSASAGIQRHVTGATQEREPTPS